jgi:hypothetical protein
MIGTVAQPGRDAAACVGRPIGGFRRGAQVPDPKQREPSVGFVRRPRPGCAVPPSWVAAELVGMRQEIAVVHRVEAGTVATGDVEHPSAPKACPRRWLANCQRQSWIAPARRRSSRAACLEPRQPPVTTQDHCCIERRVSRCTRFAPSAARGRTQGPPEVRGQGRPSKPRSTGARWSRGREARCGVRGAVETIGPYRQNTRPSGENSVFVGQRPGADDLLLKPVSRTAAAAVCSHQRARHPETPTPVR